MIRPLHPGSCLTSRLAWRDESAAQLVEFAVSLPLLVLFVVGIFDFSGAFTLKQKLTNIARDSARAAAAEPSTDLAQSIALPASVNDAFQLVQNYLIANKISDCGVSSSLYINGPGPIWTFPGTSTNCPTGGLTVIINRAYYFPANVATQAANVTCQSQTAGNNTAVISTCVSIQYAYAWRFGRVASLFGSATALPTKINAVAIAMNED